MYCARRVLAGLVLGGVVVTATACASSSGGTTTTSASTSQAVTPAPTAQQPPTVPSPTTIKKFEKDYNDYMYQHVVGSTCVTEANEYDNLYKQYGAPLTQDAESGLGIIDMPTYLDPTACGQ